MRSFGADIEDDILAGGIEAHLPPVETLEQIRFAFKLVRKSALLRHDRCMIMGCIGQLFVPFEEFQSLLAAITVDEIKKNVLEPLIAGERDRGDDQYVRIRRRGRGPR
jgi:hypothetical protein